MNKLNEKFIEQNGIWEYLGGKPNIEDMEILKIFLLDIITKRKIFNVRLREYAQTLVGNSHKVTELNKIQARYKDIEDSIKHIENNWL